MADTEGFEEFYRVTVGRLLGVLFPMTGDLHEAEEIAQEAYARASTRWARLREYDVPEAWVRRVAMNLATDRGRRIAAGVASLLFVAVVAGAAGTGQLANRPPLPVTPATIPPPAPDLQGRTDKPRPGSLEEDAFRQLTSELRRCPGGSSIPADLIGSVWSERYQRLWMVAAKQPPAGEKRFCWTSGLFDATGNGSRWGARRVASLTSPLTSLGGRSNSGPWVIEGRVSKEATRLQLRFWDGRTPMDLALIDAGDRYPVNFYVGLFSQSDASFQQDGWSADTLAAFDAAGRTVTSCRVGPPGNGSCKCPGN